MVVGWDGKLKASIVQLERMWMWGSREGFGTGRQEDQGWGSSDKRGDRRDVEDRRKKREESDGED